MQIKQQQHYQALLIEMRVFERFVPVFLIINHTAHQTLLYKQLIFSRLFQGCAFQFCIDKSKIRLLSTIYIVLKIQFLHKLTKPSFSRQIMIFMHEIPKGPANQLLAIIEDRHYVFLVIRQLMYSCIFHLRRHKCFF